MSCLHARGISDLPMGNGPVLQQQQLSGVPDGGSDYVSASDSDGASVGAPTRARHVNDRSAPAFDMNAFA